MEIKGIGWYYRDLFGDADYYTPFITTHKPQVLTESNKPDQSYRKGVYLTDVTKDLRFRLLRCSTNLDGPTENFSDTDRWIIDKAQTTASIHYPGSALLNHVLAQVYYNKTIDGKIRRAKIPAHSDKTEDMPNNGLIVFCTFYDPTFIKRRNSSNPGDELTSLKFVSKETGAVTVIPLHPNSALFIDLDINRTHTHRIVPPNLSPEDIPTRLGYVIRCSKQEAIFNGYTHLLHPETKEYTKLQCDTPEKIKELKELYAVENMTPTTPAYPFIDFSLNKGDYLEPKVNLMD